MQNENPKTVYILGAGFSAAGGLPIQAEFPRRILETDTGNAAANFCGKVAKQFFEECFGWDGSIETVPSLEDVFTMIDLSAGTGHNLGVKYTPKMLRALRRLLIFKIIHVLNSNKTASDAPAIAAFAKRAASEGAGFVVLNWDVVLENSLKKHTQRDFHYCIPSYKWPSRDEFFPAPGDLPIAKIHGSANWVYCDNCRGLSYDPFEKLALDNGAGLTTADFRAFDRGMKGAEVRAMLPGEAMRCKICGSAVGSHIATFSFKKSFRTPAFAGTWQVAERLLANSDHWVFVGYSMPDADYEFRHTLKLASLRRMSRNRPKPERIEAIMKCDKASALRFRRFFGNDRVEIHQRALDGYLSNPSPGIAAQV